MADAVGQRITAETMEELQNEKINKTFPSDFTSANLDVAKAVGHAGRVPHGDLSPKQVLGAIQGGHGSQTNSVRKIRKILQLWEFWKCNVVICCLLFQSSPEELGFKFCESKAKQF